MCISCGNCSTYCEMGIDVRAHAMANQDVERAPLRRLRHVRAHVCPRGAEAPRTSRTDLKGRTPILVCAVDG
jgi:ferredoxin